MKCESLDVWKRACRLSVDMYRHFNDSREYGFKEQITRSALSIGSNIAEGMEKESLKENIRFLEIAKGSVAELITQLYIGIEADFIEKRQGLTWVKECNEVLKMIKGLQYHISKGGENEK